MQNSTSPFISAKSLMRLLDVAICGASQSAHSKKALEIAEATSKLLIGPRMDFALGSVMWMAGEQQAAAEVLERVAADPEVGTSAKAMLAMLFATEGDAQWKNWSEQTAVADPDELHVRMLMTAEQIAVGDADKAAQPPAQPALVPSPLTAGVWA